MIALYFNNKLDMDISIVREKLENIKINSLGLYQGKIGFLICRNYLYELKDANEIVKSLCDIRQEIENIKDNSFSSGLLGICWGIAKLNESIKLDRKLIGFLSDFDDSIYKSITNYQTCDFSLETGLIGKGLYLYQRLKSRREINFYRILTLRECLVLIVLEIKNYLRKIFDDVYRSLSPQDGINILHSINYLYLLKELEVNPLLIENIIYDIKCFLIEYIRNNPSSTIQNNLLFHYIANLSQDEDMLKNYCFNSLGNIDYLELQKILLELLSFFKQPFWFMI